MQRRSFLLGALSTAITVGIAKPGRSGEIERWRAYNSASFEQARNGMIQGNDPWIDVDLRRMKVTGVQGNEILSYQHQPLVFLCDDGDLNNPSITGQFYPDSTQEIVSMSGMKQLNEGYREYKNVITHYVIFFANGYALHGLDPNYRTSGSHVSAGCIRLNYTDAKALYEAHQARPFKSIVLGYSNDNNFRPWYALG
jgi:hypothetical protein